MSLIKKNEFFLLSEVVKRNFSAKYKESTLGILWSVLHPLFTMIILTIVFSTLFSRSIENYAVYLLCGRNMFSFFTGACTTSLLAIKANQNILVKTAAPKHIFIIGGIISEFINFLICTLLLLAVMFATNAPFYWNTIPLTIVPIIFAIILSTGVGLILSICQVYYTDTQHIWSVITTMLLYGSALFYPMDVIPEPFHQYMILNPVFWLVDQYRSFFIYGTIPDLLYMANTLLLSTIILVFGLIVFKKYNKKLAMKF